MNTYKKLLIALVIIITFYLLYILINKRLNINNIVLENMDTDESPGENNEFLVIQNKPIPSIGNAPIHIIDLPIREYIIKSSYNSAFTGSFVNLEMVEHLLLRGCRFLDFEIYNVDNQTYVGTSSDVNSLEISSSNKILLNYIFKTISNNAFKSPVPNVNDPCFIHLRIKTDNNDTYKDIANLIEVYFKDRLHKGKITGSTKLSEISGKIIIVIDKNTAPNYNKYPVCSTDKNQICYNLKNFVNLESGGDDLRTYRYTTIINEKNTPPLIMDDKLNSNVFNYKLILPDLGGNFFGIMNNPDHNLLISNHSAQIICYNFYNRDSNLDKYEQFFGIFKSSFVPFSSAIPILNQM